MAGGRAGRSEMKSRIRRKSRILILGKLLFQVFIMFEDCGDYGKGM